MRVLHVISGLPRAAGTSVFCVELCNHLGRQGVECCIAVRQKGENDFLPHSSVPVFEVDGDPSALPFKPDIVHIHALWDPFLHRFATWARGNQIPLVYSPHGMLTPWALKQKRLKKGIALALYQYRDLKSAALLHATADSEVDDIRCMGLKPAVVVAPLGVDVPPDPPRIRNNSTKIALFVSRIHPKKGLFNLIDAWAILKNRQSAIGNWRFVIAGPDQDGHAAEVMERARTAGIDGDFEMVGPVFGKDKDELYAKADLFVLPTYSENFGVVVIEALAHGCPVITTKGTPWAELLGYQERVNSKPLIVNSEPGRELADNQLPTVYGSQLTDFTANGRCGWWIDIGVEPLAKALEEAMGLSDEERRAMGENGRKLVETKYTWPAIAEQMKAAYAWVLNGGDVSPSVIHE